MCGCVGECVVNEKYLMCIYKYIYIYIYMRTYIYTYLHIYSLSRVQGGVDHLQNGIMVIRNKSMRFRLVTNRKQKGDNNV